MDAQDKQDHGLLHGGLTRKIIGCALEVINELGSGFLESVYEKALTVALSDAGVSHEMQKPIAVRFRGRPVGDFIADILVEDKVIVELKAVKALTREHESPDHQLPERNRIRGRATDQLREAQIGV